MFLEVQQGQKMLKMGETPATRTNHKVVRPLPKSIIHARKQVIARYNRHLLTNQNCNVAHHLREKKSDPRLSLEEVVRNDSVKHSPVKAYVQHV